MYIINVSFSIVNYPLGALRRFACKELSIINCQSTLAFVQGSVVVAATAAVVTTAGVGAASSVRTATSVGTTAILAAIRVIRGSTTAVASVVVVGSVGAGEALHQRLGLRGERQLGRGVHLLDGGVAGGLHDDLHVADGKLLGGGVLGQLCR